VVVTLRVGAAPTAPVRVGLAGSSVPLGPTLAGLAPGTWTEVTIPLACFAQAGAPLSAVRRVFELDTEGPLDLAVSRVAFGPAAGTVLACPGP
jgi:beta-glucosidase